MIDYLKTAKEYWFYIVMALLAFAIMYIYFEPAPTEIVETKSSEAITGELKEVETETLKNDVIKAQLDSSFSHIAILQDVTEGQKILGYQTSGLSRGRALIKYNKEEEKSTLVSTLINVPEIEENTHYFGWIVNQDEEKYIFVGEYKFSKDRITTGITTSENLTEYDKYVVTLQQSSENLTGRHKYPGDKFHILEGEIKSE